MKDYLEEAERVWRDAGGVYRRTAAVGSIAAALQAAYREGVEAMRERFVRDRKAGIHIYSAETARAFAETCAELVLGEEGGTGMVMIKRWPQTGMAPGPW